ncbi:flocculation protein FLO11-like isoform X2 [Diaphorina citri]|uniref:Flocculation protein FLO11-like isoform X2 n=1 Tax=Diaphorina citri TaxID=121845 RepID=A0A3Q0IWI5_DIACI|nr:flocculation protein FLO11-like isoform X2 [Diaphorina citri]
MLDGFVEVTLLLTVVATHGLCFIKPCFFLQPPLSAASYYYSRQPPRYQYKPYQYRALPSGYQYSQYLQHSQYQQPSQYQTGGYQHLQYQFSQHYPPPVPVVIFLATTSERPPFGSKPAVQVLPPSTQVSPSTATSSATHTADSSEPTSASTNLQSQPPSPAPLSTTTNTEALKPVTSSTASQTQQSSSPASASSTNTNTVDPVGSTTNSPNQKPSAPTSLPDSSSPDKKPSAPTSLPDSSSPDKKPTPTSLSDSSSSDKKPSAPTSLPSPPADDSTSPSGHRSLSWMKKWEQPVYLTTESKLCQTNDPEGEYSQASQSQCYAECDTAYEAKLDSIGLTEVGVMGLGGSCQRQYEMRRDVCVCKVRVGPNYNTFTVISEE